jgi:hypothetical protein
MGKLARRPLIWGARVMRGVIPRALPALDGSWLAFIAMLFGLAGIGAKIITAPDSPWPIYTAIGGFGIAFIVSAYREWDRWAPHEPPRLGLHLEWSDLPLPPGRRSSPWALMLVIRNDDPRATYCADVSAVHSGGEAAVGVPFHLTWGGNDTTQLIARGQSTRLAVVVIDASNALGYGFGHDLGPIYTFPPSGAFSGPRPGPIGIGPNVETDSLEAQIRVCLFRLDPPSDLELEIRIEFSCDGRAEAWLGDLTQPRVRRTPKAPHQ